MPYDVLDVAEYIVDHQTRKGYPFTPLKLQKMLYFLWEYYYSQTTKHLFENRIEAWPYGPVCPDVYNRYCMYAGDPISETSSSNFSNIDKKTIRIINTFLSKYGLMNAFYLVAFSHQEGSPWYQIYHTTNRGQIPFDLMEKDAMEMEWA